MVHDDQPPIESNLRAVTSRLDAFWRVLRRVFDLDDPGEIDLATLTRFREAITYAVKMKAREEEIDRVIAWVLSQMSSEISRKDRDWSNVRRAVSILGAAVAGALATKYLAK